jgi:hypothetical protein
MRRQRIPPGAEYANNVQTQRATSALTAPLRSWLRNQYLRRVLAYVNGVDGLRGRAEVRRRVRATSHAAHGKSN